MIRNKTDIHVHDGKGTSSRTASKIYIYTYILDSIDEQIEPIMFLCAKLSDCWVLKLLVKHSSYSPPFYLFP